MKEKRRNGAYRTAMYGILVALAMILSYVETLIPISIGIPGVKLGLANLVVVVALYAMEPADALIISMVRILLVGMTFGNMAAWMYSAAGGLLSYTVMLFCKRKQIFHKVGVSVTGGIFHNIGQLIVAALILENAAVFTYFPVLLISGTITGTLIGILGGEILRRLPNPNDF